MTIVFNLNYTFNLFRFLPPKKTKKIVLYKIFHLFCKKRWKLNFLTKIIIRSTSHKHLILVLDFNKILKKFNPKKIFFVFTFRFDKLQALLKKRRVNFNELYVNKTLLNFIVHCYIMMINKFRLLSSEVQFNLIVTIITKLFKFI